MARLDDAAKAHRAAQAGIEAAKQKAAALIATARERAEQARQELADAIVEETLRGTPQVEVIRRTGLARETVRTTLRRAGIEPD